MTVTTTATNATTTQVHDDARPVTHTTLCGAAFAEAHGMVALLTRCCGATGKGSMVADQPAVVCRGCYRETDAVYGDGATLNDPAGVQRLIETAPHVDCPVPHECATHAIWTLEAARDRLAWA